MGGHYEFVGVVHPQWDLWACAHGKAVFDGKERVLGVLTSLALTHQEWCLIVKPGKRMLFLECQRCNGLTAV